MESCARKIHFCYGHRVMHHESKCATLHGHNGVLWIYATPVQGLDALGRVIDFSVLKAKIGAWVEDNWDHTMILFKEDHKTIELVAQAPAYKKPFIFDTNSTAENLAKFLLWEVCPKLLKGHGVIVHKIIFYETENCLAELSLIPNSADVLKLYRE